MLDDADHRSREEQERHAELYDARRREPKFEIDDRVWKKNRVLSSAAQGVMAKLALKYVSPYEILEKKGPNTYSLVDQDGDIEDLVHAEYLKPYFAKNDAEDDNSTPSNEEDDVARPPRDDEEMATSDPPLLKTQPPAGVGSDQDEIGIATQARGRGRPRKTAIITRRPADAPPVPTTPVPVASEPPKRPRGRPKGSRNHVLTCDTVSTSPRRTRANPN